MKKILIITVLFSIFLYGDSVVSWKNYLNQNIQEKQKLFKTSGSLYDYLNELRTATGLNTLTYNALLEQSSQNHADFIVANKIVGHNEIEGYPNFTGVDPSDRAYYVGFNSGISENLSVGQSDYLESIDDLFGAIYHRFGFLSFDIDLVGIANSGSANLNTFVYNMGNNALETLCLGDSFTGYGTYYTSICKDKTKKIEESQYDAAKNISNPNYVIWPYENYNNTPPVFFEESPDPLPNQGVSGYPISIQFNPNYYTSGVEVNSFELFDKNNNQVTNVSLINKTNDVNSKFGDNEFALFPLDRLEWGSIYKAKIVFKDLKNNSTQTKEWSFKTKSLDYDYYILSDNDESINLISGKTYVLYLKPQNNNEYSNSYSMNTTTSSQDLEYIDLNTLKVTLNGTINSQATLNFANGRTLNINLSSSDNAISKDTQDEELLNEVSPESFDYKLDSLSSGWHLLGAVEDISDLSLFDDIDIIWTYKDGSWYVYSNDTLTKQNIQNSNFKDLVIEKINQGEGFWIYK